MSRYVANSMYQKSQSDIIWNRGSMCLIASHTYVVFLHLLAPLRCRHSILLVFLILLYHLFTTSFYSQMCPCLLKTCGYANWNSTFNCLTAYLEPHLLSSTSILFHKPLIPLDLIVDGVFALLNICKLCSGRSLLKLQSSFTYALHLLFLSHFVLLYGDCW